MFVLLTSVRTDRGYEPPHQCVVVGVLVVVVDDIGEFVVSTLVKLSVTPPPVTLASYFSLSSSSELFRLALSLFSGWAVM